MLRLDTTLVTADPSYSYLTKVTKGRGCVRHLAHIGSHLVTKGPTLGLQAERAWRAWRARRARYGRVAGSAAGVHGAIFSGHGRGGGNVPWRRAAGVQEEPGNKGN